MRPIGIVTPLYPPAVGGVERHVERLASGLVARGQAVEVVTTDPRSRAPVTETRDGLTIHRFPTVAGDGIYFAAPALGRWLAAHAGRFRLLHAHNLHTLIPLTATIATRHRRTPMVVTAHYHGTGHTPLRRLLHAPYRPFAKRVVHGAAAVICNSAAERRLLARDLGAHPKTRIVLPGIDLPHTVDRPAFDRPTRGPDGREAGAPTILTVGRLEAYKAVDRIVSALAHLPAHHRLIVIGDGPERPALESLARAGGLADRVALRGHVTDEELRGRYASAAAFVSFSRHEAFGLTVLEAAASGCPVVASDISPHREIARLVPDGRVALVDPDATPRVLAQAIIRQLATGRTDPVDPASPVPGWSLPTWDELVEGVLSVYRRVEMEAVSRPAGSPRPARRG